MHNRNDLNRFCFPTIYDQVGPDAPKLMALIQQIFSKMPHPRHIAKSLAFIVDSCNYAVC